MATLLHGDCLDLMAGIATASVDMVLCDLPYGTTACKWDSVIPFEPLWAQYRRIAKPNAAIVLTASQPFTTALIASNMKDFRYCWVWEKTRVGQFANAKNRPLLKHEDICVFSQGRFGNGSAAKIPYFPQGLKAANIRTVKRQGGDKDNFRPGRAATIREYVRTATGYPTTILEFASEGRTVHPTQKPVALMEYLIRTYTNEGATVLDNCMGSGTTGVACANTGREFIGIERDDKYFEIARQRIEGAQQLLAA